MKEKTKKKRTRRKIMRNVEAKKCNMKEEEKKTSESQKVKSWDNNKFYEDDKIMEY